jgi:uncharacterized membrane protein YphA (DoxX/SURF4 family)
MRLRTLALISAKGKRTVKNFFIRHQGLHLIARLIVGGVFVYAGILKMSSPLEFADEIAAYQLLPASAINPLALGLPFFEITCGLLVMAGFHIRIGSTGISAMLLMFMGAIALALKKGLLIDCGCFGGHSWFESNLWVALGRDGLLLLLAAFIYRHSLLKEQEQHTLANT